MRLLPALALSACSAATCPSAELYGHDAELVYLDPAQPWPCGRAPASNAGCDLVSDRCLPLVFECADGLQLEVTADTLTVVTDDGCRDEHGVRWER